MVAIVENIAQQVYSSRGLHGRGGPRAGPGRAATEKRVGHRAIELTKTSRAGQSLVTDGPGRAGPEKWARADLYTVYHVLTVLVSEQCYFS
jgi:hypothetical protein